MSNPNRINYNLAGAQNSPSPPSPRVPVIVFEGITGIIKPTGLAVSLTQIEVLDLLGEGEIEGLVTGEYTYQGNLGQIGYTSAQFTPFNPAPGTDVRFLRSIYWDEVPVVAPSATGTTDEFNFQQIQVSFTPGLPLGATISQNNSNFNNALTISRTISERLRAGVPFQKTYRILNKDCKSANLNLRISQLSYTDQNPATYGDILETEIDFNISYRPLFINPAETVGWNAAPVISHSLKGKITYGYIDSIPLPFSQTNGSAFGAKDFLGWEIQITRLTPDSTDISVLNQTYVDSLTEIYGDTYSYPNSAIVASKFSAEYFSQIPARAFDTRLLKVLIPSNYDPILKVYGAENGGPLGTTAVWDGTFKSDKEWTDNPAWCFYDLVTNSRYGLGQYIDTSFVDKWSLYEISQYCDVMVPDGLGGIEPRFSCNLIFTSRAEAYTVLNNFASVFRAMLYYGAGLIYAVQDSEKPVLYQFTNDNVEDGNFGYSSSSRRVRHTVAIVQYNDKTNFYKPAVEYVEDIAGIRKYGVRELQLNAFGCTSRGQAIRFARWALITEIEETEIISFSAGLEGSYIKPGDIFSIVDSNQQTQRQAGRTYQIVTNPTGALITLDSQITGFNPLTTYGFTLITPTYNYDSTLVQLTGSNEIPSIRNVQTQNFQFLGSQAGIITGNDNIARTQINLTTPLDTQNYIVQGNPVYAIESSGVMDSMSNQSVLYRAIKIEEKDDNKFDITALEYNAAKFDEIESGLSFSSLDYLKNVASPTNLSLNQQNLTPDGNVKIINYSFTISNLSGITSFPIYAKTGSLTDFDVTGAFSNQNLIAILPASVTSGSLVPFNNGDYFFRAYARNFAGQLSSSYAANDIVISNINPIQDVTIASLTLVNTTGVPASNGKVYESYTTSSPTFSWQAGLQQTVLTIPNLTYRITIRQPSPNNVPSNNIYYSVTGYSPFSSFAPTYNFPLATNLNSLSTQNQRGPFRLYDIVVEAMDAQGNSSAGGNFAVNGDAFYNNPAGYDILDVNNPPMTGIALSTGTCQPTDLYCTQQWISPEGEIKIYLTQFPTGITDFQGCYVYSCQVPFSADEARGAIPTAKTISSFLVNSNSNPIVANAFLTGVSYSYIAVSAFDTFDQAVLAQGTNISTGLYVSNTVKVNSLGLQSSLAFRSWLDIDFGAGFMDLNLNYTGQGIAAVNVSATPGGGNNTYDIVFVNDLGTSAYNIVHTPYTYQGNSSFTLLNFNCTTPIKTSSKFTVQAAGKHFFGVLLNQAQ